MPVCFATFSIVARDQVNGHLGIAIASKLPCVGSFCPAIQPGIGAAVTQAWTNPALPGRLFTELDAGKPADAALAAVMAAEADSAMRQVALVDAAGRAAVHTGDKVEPWKGHRLGDGVAVLGNMLRDEMPLTAMIDAYERLADAFALRLIAALSAGFEAGGDIRGNRSAALKVMGPEVFPLVDLRVDDSDRPMEELRRLYAVAEKEFLPFVAALPTRANPRGSFDTVYEQVAPKRRQ